MRLMPWQTITKFINGGKKLVPVSSIFSAISARINLHAFSTKNPYQHINELLITLQVAHNTRKILQ